MSLTIHKCLNIFFSQLEYLGLYNTSNHNHCQEPIIFIKSPNHHPEKMANSEHSEIVKSLIDMNKEVDSILKSYDTDTKGWSYSKKVAKTTKTNPLRRTKSEQLTNTQSSKKTLLKHRKNMEKRSDELEHCVNPELVLERTEVCPVHGDVSVWTTVCNHPNKA